MKNVQFIVTKVTVVGGTTDWKTILMLLVFMMGEMNCIRDHFHFPCHSDSHLLSSRLDLVCAVLFMSPHSGRAACAWHF